VNAPVNAPVNAEQVVASLGPSRSVAAAALVALPGMGRTHVRAILDRWPDPGEALRAVLRGDAGTALSEHEHHRPLRIDEWAARVDPDGVARRLAERATRVLLRDDPEFPFETQLDECPAVLLTEGAGIDALDRPRVAIVGTRAATPHGLADAHELAAALAGLGITIVSGLAIGIDGAAHEGAISVPGGATIGVVATGLDVIYPRRHARLTTAVRDRGLLMSEHWFGTPPERHRFPVRNRIIAALADVVVVVEATARGGALNTAEWASRYDRPVLVPPGSRRNPAAEGTNRLLREFATPLLDPGDVLQALCFEAGYDRGGAAPWKRAPSWSTAPQHPLSEMGTEILAAFAGDPATVDQLSSRTGRPLADVTRAVTELEGLGRVERRRGFLWPT
jgi:DNA processing protein